MSYKEVPGSLVVAIVLSFVLWLAWSTDSRWERTEDGALAAASHDVSLGLLSYVEISASRPGTDAPWKVTTDVQTWSLLWTLLLTAPAAWLWHSSVAGFDRHRS